MYTDAITAQAALVADFPDVPHHKRRLGELHWDRAKNAINSRNWKAAVDDLRTAITYLEKRDYYRYEALLHLAECHKAMGQPAEEARARAEANEQIPPQKVVNAQEIIDGTAESYVSRGMYYMRSDHNSNYALADFSKAIQLDAQDAEAYHWRAEAQRNLGHLAEAQQDIATAIDLQPDEALSHFTSATINGKLNKWDAALADLNRAIELDPEVPRYFDERATVNVKLGRYAAAIADREETLKLGAGPETPFYLMLAHLLSCCPDTRLRNPTRAVQLVEEAIKSVPTASRMFYSIVLAKAYWRLGDKEKASAYARDFMREIRREIADRPLDPHPRTILAWELFTWPDPRVGDPDEAIKVVEQALNLKAAGDGTKTFAARLRGLDHLRNGNWSECIAAMEECSKLLPDTQRPEKDIERLALAIAYWRRGHHHEARDWFQKAVASMDDPAKWNDDLMDLAFTLDVIRAEAEELLGIKTEVSKAAATATNAKE
jgi:tetratricopeptide (TPR) repeat protein